MTQHDTKQMELINLSTALADVIESLLIDIEYYSKLTGKDLRHEKKRNYTLLIQTAKRLKTLSKLVADDGYKISQVNEFCEDSDFIKDLLLKVIHIKPNILMNKINEIQNN